jgi:hypothetical protein
MDLLYRMIDLGGITIRQRVDNELLLLSLQGNRNMQKYIASLKVQFIAGAVDCQFPLVQYSSKSTLLIFDTEAGSKKSSKRVMLTIQMFENMDGADEG